MAGLALEEYSNDFSFVLPFFYMRMARLTMTTWLEEPWLFLMTSCLSQTWKTLFAPNCSKVGSLIPVGRGLAIVTNVTTLRLGAFKALKQPWSMAKVQLQTCDPWMPVRGLHPPSKIQSWRILLFYFFGVSIGLLYKGYHFDWFYLLGPTIFLVMFWEVVLPENEVV